MVVNNTFFLNLQVNFTYIYNKMMDTIGEIVQRLYEFKKHMDASRNNLFYAEVQLESLTMNIKDLVDISVIWYLIYNLLYHFRGTKTMEIIKGIACLIALRILAEFWSLHTVARILDHFIQCGTIALIVIFQPEIRKLFENLGRKVYIKQKTINFNDKIITALDGAIQYLAERKIGALITFQRRMSLDEYIATGIVLDAAITEELLISIFIPKAPLHDGAVIIRNGRIVVCSAYLPSSENTQIPKRYGTRHRAAIGMSEVSDAVTVVVSEETGEVSITANNVFYDNVTKEEYRNILRRELIQNENSGGKLKM